MPEARKQDVNILEFLDDVGKICDVTVNADINARTLLMDSAQIEQVLINLVKNARESGSAEEEVRFFVRQINDGIQFEVVDRGNGLGGEQLSQAMLPFYTTKKKGTGIGLPLCNEIITGHGGRSRLENRQGGGVQVCFSIPLLPDET